MNKYKKTYTYISYFTQKHLIKYDTDLLELLGKPHLYEKDVQVKCNDVLGSNGLHMDREKGKMDVFSYRIYLTNTVR